MIRWGLAVPRDIGYVSIRRLYNSSDFAGSATFTELCALLSAIQISNYFLSVLTAVFHVIIIIIVC